ncbi:MAG: peptide chain release factor 3, partial [Erysipelotrichales bacterium]|nr:peptide chain release factor 3 [Erysipelotrichales bacterium]
HAKEGTVDPFDENFSGFFFKIQANMNKMHRDRLAFLRIVSGRYTKDMEVLHVQRGKTMRLSQPQALMAQKREIVEEAVAGDIIGIFDPGIFSIGDTVCAVGNRVEFDGIPTFAPEHFALITQKNTDKRDQFVKGITQIAQEGAIQVYHEPHTGFERIYVGVVGMLQFEVLEYRLKTEYNVEIVRENLEYELLRWIESRDIRPESIKLSIDAKLLEDLAGNPLILFANAWNIKGVLDRNPGLKLSEVKTQ